MQYKTPLFEQHQLAQAKIIDFHGWQLPLHYGSQIEEHHQVRNDCGVFDVSHMTIVDLLGAGGRQLLRSLLANDVDKLAHTGCALYSCMLNTHGGIIDDLIVYECASDHYRLVLNAATKNTDLAWLRDHANGYSVGVQVRSDLAMLAIQGPHAIEKTMQIFDPAQMDAVSTLQRFEGVEVDDWFIARTGYTGEDGLELMAPANKIAGVWESLLKIGIKPIGLGARDSLRLEAGLLLYGQDMDQNTTPLESGLEWTVAWEPSDRNFMGRRMLESQKQQGVKRKLVGLILQASGVMRAGQSVLLENGEQGIITSGGYSPTLEKSIALARVPADMSATCLVEIRDKQIGAQVVKPRFVKEGQVLI